MTFSAKILADSICNGHRLTTMEVTYPRMIHAEMCRHRMFSRNTASSRAIPIQKMIDQVREHPVMPPMLANQKGMQGSDTLTPDRISAATREWEMARYDATRRARILLDLGVHKQVVNRLLEPWMWTTEIISATEWGNFFYLRVDPAAEPQMQKIARIMFDTYEASKPVEMQLGWWHLPMAAGDDTLVDYSIEYLKKIAVGRCARASYLTHDGKRDPDEDIALHDRLAASGHWSPFEHVAVPESHGTCAKGNFKGWVQYRSVFQHENRTLAEAMEKIRVEAA